MFYEICRWESVVILVSHEMGNECKNLIQNSDSVCRFRFPKKLSSPLSLSHTHISSSWWCHAIGMDITDPFSPLLPIVHSFQLVLRATPRILQSCLSRFKLVALLSLGHVKGSTRVHHLWARPYISSSVLHVWFV